MKNIFIIGLIAFANNPFAQITITGSDFPSPSDTAMISISDDFGLDLITTGANATWDFSTLNITQQRIDTFNTIWDASLTYQAVFNNFILDPDYAADYYSNLIGFDLGGAAAAGITITNPIGFTKITSSQVQNIGFGMDMNGVSVPAKADTIDVQFELPINYSDSWVSLSYINLDLNPVYDGIFRRHQQRNSIVDGWGQITTPYGTFDAIRVKSFVTTTDSIYVNMAGGVWFEAPTPDVIEYSWFTNGQKVPILFVTSQNTGTGDIVNRVEFKDFDRGFLATEKYESFTTELYPNPTSDKVNFIFQSPINNLSIYNLAGELVFSEQNIANTFILNIENWEKGMYLVKIVDDNNVSTAKFVVE